MRILPEDSEFSKLLKRIYNTNIDLMKAFDEEDSGYIGMEDIRG